MRFLIVREVGDEVGGHIPGRGMMSVDNETIMLDASALDSDIGMITWEGNAGKIEYNDRPEVREPITDIAPYQSWLDRFMHAVATADPPLNLEQARQLKIDMVEALYTNKRQKPFPYGGREYECSDEAITHMSSALAVVTNDILTSATGIGLIPAINAAFATMSANINTSIVGPSNSSAASVNLWSFNMQVNWQNIVLVYGSLFGGNTTPQNFHTGLISYPDPGSGGFQSVSQPAAPTVNWPATGLGNNVPWQPLNSNVVIDIPFDVFREALRGVVNRRNVLNRVRQDHKREIRLRTIVAAVIDYDVTTGWPP